MSLRAGFYIPKSSDRLSQGSLLTDVIYRRTVAIEEDGIKIDETTLPYVFILNQDCELEQDFSEREDSERENNDKHLTSIVGVPAFLSSDLKEGKHFNGFGLTMRRMGSDEWRTVKGNQKERYFYIKENEEFDLPSLTLDFKHFYTFKYEELQTFVKDNPSSYKYCINYFHREDLSRRFTSFISRIAIPDEILGVGGGKEGVE